MNKFKTIIYLLAISALLATGSNNVLAGEVTGTIGNGGAVGTPNTPTGLTATPSSTTQINLTWDAVSGVDGYELYRDDSLLASTTDTSYSDTGLSTATAYSYKVRSYIASVKSAFTSVVSATTESELEPEPTPVSSGNSSSSSSSSGSYTPPTTVTTPTEEPGTTEEESTTEEVDGGTLEGSVLGEKIDVRQAQVNQIVAEAGEVVDGDVSKILANVNKERDPALEVVTVEKYTTELISGITGLEASQANAITNFVAYGTESTLTLGAGERAGVVNSYKAAFGKLPTTADEWSDALKIASGRWPTERSEAAETAAATSFEKIYLRAPDRTNPNDDAAVTIMSYGLRPDQRNLDSEKAGILTFKAIYGYNPSSATDWDAVRAIAYSGAKR